MPMLSIVIPVYNEEESLAVLHQEIVAIAPRLGMDLELFFVDDGSRDRSWEVIGELSRHHSNVQGIRFRRNFGKAAALAAGFGAARGEVIMTLDADLQDDPAEIPRFLEALARGTPTDGKPGIGSPGSGTLDVVSGWKQRRLDPWHKVWPSWVFNRMVSSLTGVHLHDHNCGMKCYRAEIFREIRLYGELHRFIPVLAAARGYRVGELVINHRERKFGHSKYGVRRFIKGFLDLLTVKFLTGFGQRPQHMLGAVGLGSFSLGLLGMIYLGITWLINYLHPDSFPPLHRRPLLIYAVAALLMGGQFMSIGFLAELITAYQGKDEHSFSIAETTPPGSNKRS